MEKEKRYFMEIVNEDKGEYSHVEQYELEGLKEGDIVGLKLKTIIEKDGFKKFRFALEKIKG